jgi:hypothetical protein
MAQSLIERFVEFSKLPGCNSVRRNVVQCVRFWLLGKYLPQCVAVQPVLARLGSADHFAVLQRNHGLL